MADSLDDLGDPEFIASALYLDVEAIRSYGEANPESWTGLRFENEPRVCIVASFVRELEPHELELRRLLAHPDRLKLEHARWTKSQLDAVATEVRRIVDHRQAQTERPVMASLGVGIGIVNVGLQADQEDLAAELAGRFGDAIELEVGAFGYPIGRGRSRYGPQRRPEPEIVEIEGLELRLKLERRVFEVGHRGRADLVVRNVGTDRFGPFQFGQPLTSVLLDDSDEVVGGLGPVAIAGTGRVIDLAPGEELQIAVLTGTASYREDLGYVLPPGRYWIRTQLPIREGHGPNSPVQVLRPPLEK